MFKKIGFLLGFVGSFIFDVFGTRPCILFGSICSFINYGIILTGIISQSTGSISWFPKQYWVFAIASLIGGSGSAAIFTACIGASLKNFSSQYRGIISGISTAMVGLCGVIFSIAYTYVFRSNLIAFFIFCTITVGGMPLVFGVPFVNTVTKKQSKIESQIFIDGEGEAETVSSSINNVFPQESDETIQETLQTKKMSYLRDLNPLKLLIQLDFWLLFSLCFIGIGTGFVNINNLGTIAKSQQYDGHILSILVSIFSAVGKICVGFLTDRFAFYVSRVGFFSFCVFGMGLPQIAHVFIPVFPYYFVTMPMLGFFYGGLWACIPSIISDLFGQTYYGINSTLVNVGPALASYLLATLIFSGIYQSHIPYHGGNMCYGVRCTQLTFIITFVLCCVMGTILGFCLTFRTRHIYTEIYEEKIHQKVASSAKNV